MPIPPEQLTPEAARNQIGDEFFVSPHKLLIGMWIARKEIGVAFNNSEVAEALTEYNFQLPETIVGRYMPAFVKTNLVQTIGPTGRRRPRGTRNLWSRLENPWWAMFEGANKAFDETS